MLDLKGFRRRLSWLVVDRLGPYLGERRFTVCARSWKLLDAFAGLPVTCVHSVGSRRQLRALLRGARGEAIAAVAIHERLLDAAVVAELRTLAGLVLTWPVNRAERAAQLARLGVDGLITDDTDALARSVVAGALA
jgi:glycerophosphoryl diester phosphodiesterase